VQTAFKVAEADRDGLDSLFVVQILHAFFAQRIQWDMVQALGFDFKIEFLKFFVRNFEEIAEGLAHDCTFIGGFKTKETVYKRQCLFTISRSAKKAGEKEVHFAQKEAQT
jgi:hypothetical protein